MTGEQSLIARGVLGAVTGIISVAAASHPYPRRLSSQRFDRLIAIAFAASRLGLFGLVFLLLRIPPRGDIPAYYWEEALSVLHGLIPYRDFSSSYAPLHPYLDAVAVLVWHSPLAIILLAILAEAAMLWLWMRFGRELLSETEIRTAALLYVTSGVSLQFVTIDGQNNVIIAALVALALLLALRHRELISGAAIGIGVAAVKFLPLLYAPAFFLSLRRRWRWTVGLAIPIVAVYGTCLALRVPALMPLEFEGNMRGASNFSHLFEWVLGVDVPGRAWDLLMVLVVAGIFVLHFRTVRGKNPEVQLRGLIFCIAALTIALLCFSKKSWPNYLMLALFPICLTIDSRRMRDLIGFACFSFVAVVEHSYFATVVGIPVHALHAGMLKGQQSVLIYLVLEVLLIAGYGWLLTISLRRMMAAADFPEEIVLKSRDANAIRAGESIRVG